MSNHDSNKVWERPWTMEEIIENADNWSLAGDVAVLNSLKGFADNLLTKTNTINNHLNNLNQNLDKTTLRLSIVKNEFQSLRNTQFIENRVYEEDETLENIEQNKVQNVNTEKEDKVKCIKEAVYKGLEVIDNYFDKVEVNVTDTEEEEAEFVSYILRPKDPYINRPLPYVIGSEEWHKKWHVGLEDSSSESDVEKEPEEQFSDTASESDLPITDRTHIKGASLGASDTSSELDFSNKTGSKPVANSTFNDSRPPRTDHFGDSSDDNSLPIQTPIPTSNFAEQLAAKLGNVISQTANIEQEVNKRPIATARQTDKFSGLFSDEPPPLDDSEDEVPFKSNQKGGLFSESGGLFDDDYDESFWGGNNKKLPEKSQNVTAKPKSNLFDGDEDEVFNDKPKEPIKSQITPSTKVKSKGLFDDTDEESDEDIFSTVKKNTSNPSYLKPFTKPSSNLPLFDDEPPLLDSENVGDTQKKTIKKPVGGVSILGNTDIFASSKVKSIIKRQNTSSSENSENDKLESSDNVQKPISIVVNKEDEVKTIPEAKPRKKLFDDMQASNETTNKPKKVSLFDDDDDLFKDDLFSNITTKKFSSNLFDDEPVGDDLFASKSIKGTTAKSNLFSEIDDEHGDEFFTKNNKSKANDNSVQSTIIKNNDAIKENSSDSFSDLIPKSDNSINVDVLNESRETVNHNSDNNKQKIPNNKSETNQKMFSGDNLFGTKPSTAIKIKPSLFDDDFEDSDDIFSSPFKSQKKLVDKSENFESNQVDTNKNKENLPEEKEKKSVPNTIPAINISKPVKEEVKPVPSISLFDSTPPPDDDDWETKSDDNENDFLSDNDNQGSLFSDNDFNNQGSSLFGDLRNDSSGFPKDYTRVETDISSFGPLTSSSRRLSSDVYNEEQSNDSLFTAKKRTESVVSANLDIIPEVPKETKNINYDIKDKPQLTIPVGDSQSKSLFDITPSGLLEDLYDEFTNSNATSDSKTSLFENSKKTNNDQIAKKESEESKTEVDGDIKKINVKFEESNIKTKIEQLSDSLRADTSPTKHAGSPGKLKHNLNINVNALVPGYTPVKPKESTSEKEETASSSTEEEKETLPSSLAKKQDFNINVNALIPGSVSKKPEFQKSKSFESDSNLASSSDFSSNADGIEVLQSVTKDRVRIPVKRRPSTRRGREHIRKSCADIDITTASTTSSKQDCNNEELVVKQETVSPISTTSKVEPVNTIDNELKKDIPTSLSNVKEDKKPKVNTFKNEEKADIFSDIDDDLFTSSKSVKTAVITKVETSKALFDSDEDEDNLFGASSKKIKSVSAIPSNLKTEPSKSLQKEKKVDLFGDDDEDDDDLFGSTSTAKKIVQTVDSLFDDDDDLFGSTHSSAKTVVRSGPKQVPQAEKKIVKSSGVKKLENKHTNDDPLSALLK